MTYTDDTITLRFAPATALNFALGALGLALCFSAYRDAGLALYVAALANLAVRLALSTRKTPTYGLASQPVIASLAAVSDILHPVPQPVTVAALVDRMRAVAVETKDGQLVTMMPAAFANAQRMARDNLALQSIPEAA